MNKKIYIVETASYDGKGSWDTETSTNYFASEARAMAYCERWMANYKKDYPDGIVSMPQERVYHFLCDIEHRQMIDDRWWDIPECRSEMMKDYRSRITAIRKEYGLTSAQVSRFMKL